MRLHLGILKVPRYEKVRVVSDNEQGELPSLTLNSLFKYMLYFSIKKTSSNFIHYENLVNNRKVERRKITTHHLKTITFDILVN